MDFPLLLPAPKPSLARKVRTWLPTAGLLVLVTALLANLFWPTTALEQAVRRAQRWPQFPPAHFFLAQALADNGYEVLAQQEFARGQKQVNSLSKVFAARLFAKDQMAAQSNVFSREKQEQEIARTDALLIQFPYSWQLWTHKAVLHYQLRQDDLANQALDQAIWLNPGNQEINLVRGWLTTDN